MKKFTLVALVVSLFLVAVIVSCEKSTKDPNTPSFLLDANNLADQTGGFYAKVRQVNVEKGIENSQKKLKLTWSDGDIKPYIVNIFFEEQDWEDFNLVSGQYEILFLKHALIINDPIKSIKHEFVVPNESLNDMQSKLPANYISTSAIRAIGISVYGNHAALRGKPALKPENCANSGGTGTSSCSNACCSITCLSGYYATCGNTCNCTKIPKGT
ncbi:hypothetical protein [Dyadobacter arcticus]|uniref:DUF4382 domain-containing protein n=1 Tax=Dyadobacter arcticus TaxID=1078754 RepID=A0ABX0UMC8_9BACT|nr:hypothetical protein [Dyadobacter arcticus]NIJ54082.1 hypothetical protein [Dyadobacter arcticus]